MSVLYYNLFRTLQMRPTVQTLVTLAVEVGRQVCFTSSDEHGGATKFEVEHQEKAAKVPSDYSISCFSSSVYVILSLWSAIW